MLELILSFLGTFFSILFSSLEIALISSNAFQINVWAKQGGRLSKISKGIINKKEESKHLLLYIFYPMLGVMHPLLL